jgi:hypothetical protein
MTVWDGTCEERLTLFYAHGVRRAFPDGLEEAKDEFANWLDRRPPSEMRFVTLDKRLVFEVLGNNTFRVRLNDAP